MIAMQNYMQAYMQHYKTVTLITLKDYIGAIKIAKNSAALYHKYAASDQFAA